MYEQIFELPPLPLYHIILELFILMTPFNPTCQNYIANTPSIAGKVFNRHLHHLPWITRAVLALTITQTYCVSS